MDAAIIPSSCLGLTNLIVTGIRDTYDLNALRFDELVGDDGVTFGFSMYRNVWYRIEEDLRNSEEWRTSRPEGSLVISGKGCRIHIYRFGYNELVELDRFRLDEAKSYTKKSIVQSNGQLRFDLETEQEALPMSVLELVVLHAGNPDDGCCGIWLGAPVPTEHVMQSPWAQIKPLWLIDRSATASRRPDTAGAQPRHSELPEPIVLVEEVEAEGPSTGEA